MPASDFNCPLPLVFLPGMMCDARLFEHQTIAFSRQRTIIHVPLIGSDSMAGLAELVLRNVPTRFLLAGLSMGGIVAMEVVRQAADRVAGLALLDTNPLADTVAAADRRTDLMERVKAGALKSVVCDDLKPNYLADGPGRGRILDLCLEMALDLGPDIFLDQSIAVRGRPDQTATLEAYSGPTTIICGADDTLCPVERHKLMADLIPHATLNIVPGAGHLPVLEQPHLTNTLLKSWLERTDEINAT